MKKTQSGNTPVFRKVGGAWQLQINTIKDLQRLLTLDAAHWALTSISVETLRFERKFLDFVDIDRNGKIRTDELREAIRFVLAVFRDYSGVESKSDRVSLTALNPEDSNGAAALEAAKLILTNLGRADGEDISISEITNDHDICACTERNGDGVITPSPELPEDLSEALELVMSSHSGELRKDISGVSGVNLDDLVEAEKAVCCYLKYIDEPAASPDKLLPFGEDTGEIYSVYAPMVSVIDDFFLWVSAREFYASAPENTPKNEPGSANGTETLRKLLNDTPVAFPTADGCLNIAGALNPLYAGGLKKLSQLPRLQSYFSKKRLTQADWLKLKAVLAPYGEWLSRSSVGAPFSAIDVNHLRELYKNGAFEELIKLAEADLMAGKVLAGGQTLLKIALLQKYIIELANNFATLSELFNILSPSRLQAGKLVMDGRHYTLAMNITDIAEHKRIINASNICVAYVEITRGMPKALVKQLLAVAITSGSMRNLFVGKRGVFFAASGETFDARIVDFIEQPVAINEALKSPFYRFGNFLTQQADKFFTSKSAAAQKDLGAKLSSGKLTLPSAPVPAPKPQTPAVSGSMILMGGGIGLAALGSSIAFIVKSLQNVSIMNVLAVLFGILLIFGGPMVITALIKLYRRNLTRYLESAGCAVNQQMRLSHKMGLIFTFTPKLPKGKKIRVDLIDLACNTKQIKLRSWIILAIIVVILGATTGALASYYFMNSVSLTKISRIK